MLYYFGSTTYNRATDAVTINVYKFDERWKYNTSS